ncbi:alkaline phosphatase D family protein [Microbulbifer spongiae]|uniref:Alkaline phosphatase family protein n=1 Tax=Microbulbifer spongiae TaxID=2944933 RepID=A0ABY9EBS5_9GAMM|nr:alkaline phosphatase D family protein [Microbulbifer sp. MI-G]WKD49533.1 alkaline phosphatase family protein [Microbulbifer sp. MI-G]
MKKINRRTVLKGMFSAAGLSLAQNSLANLGLSLDLTDSPALRRIAFGSCCDQNKPQLIWNSVIAKNPELFIFLGDNIYADTEDMEVMANIYEQQGKNFAAIRNQCNVIATWDDHDYGMNDAGIEYPKRQESRDLFLTFWGELDSPRRRDDGIYHSYYYGPADARVQVILLDLRYERAAIHKVGMLAEAGRHIKNMGPYRPAEDNRSMMSEQQWQWLEKQLKQPADLRIIGSSIQFLADFTGWEAWANYPADKNRMLSLIKKTQANGIIFVSGDTHWAELSRQTEGVPYPLYDLTSSGLTNTWSQVSPNQHRKDDAYFAERNFGQITIDWQGSDTEITLQICDINGDAKIAHTVALSELQIKETA